MNEEKTAGGRTGPTAPDILAFFDFEPAPAHISELDTPVPLVDIDVVQRNVLAWQAHCAKAGVANRPHIKTHKLVPLARYQLAAGASGITVQKLGEAEVMAEAGIKDILVSFNIVGRSKLSRLVDLLRLAEVKTVADGPKVVAGLAEAGTTARRDVPILIECDTGGGRNGVQTPSEAAELARIIDLTDGTRFLGFMTYPSPFSRGRTEDFLNAARELAARSGLECEVISTGGTPGMWEFDVPTFANEYRAGTYIYNDRSMIENGTCALKDCALSVLATVVSRPTPSRALIDAGTKALTSDLLGLEGHGVVPDLSAAAIYALNEEHGFLDIGDVERKPAVGDLVRVLPNHACPVSNLYDRVVFVQGEKVLGSTRVDARGRVQ